MKAEQTSSDESDSDFKPESPPRPAPPKRPKFTRVRKYTSCENCIIKKIKCSKTLQCAPCLMRGQRCEWIRGKPNETNNVEVTAAFAEISRLRTVVATLSARLSSHGLSISHEHLPEDDLAWTSSAHASPAPELGLLSPALSSSSLGAYPSLHLKTEPTASTSAISSILNASTPPVPVSPPAFSQPLSPPFVSQYATPQPQHRTQARTYPQNQQIHYPNPNSYFPFQYQQHQIHGHGSAPAAPWTLHAFPFLQNYQGWPSGISGQALPGGTIGHGAQGSTGATR